MRKKVINSMIEDLERALRDASHENSNFAPFDNEQGKPTVIPAGTVNEFIKEKVRLHQQTWVISPMQRVLDKLIEERDK